MRVTKFRAVLDEDNRTILAKESSTNYPNHDSINSPDAVAEMMRDIYHLHEQAVEFVYMIAVNSKSKVLGVFELSKGTVNASLMSPREIFMSALMVGAVNIIMVHNHPSGNPEPSNDDIQSTKRVQDAGTLLGVKLLDHIIIGDKRYVSLKEQDFI